MSLPYHIGNGWFGGLLPATSFAIVASTGDIYAGLWYPIIFASITAVVGFFFLPETKGRRYQDVLIVARGDRRADDTQTQQAGRGAIRGRFCIQRQPILLRGLFANQSCRKLQHDFPPVRTSPVLDQVNPLPRSKRQIAIEDGDLQRGRRQHGLDVRRHIIGTFGVVAPPCMLRGQPIECGRQIHQHRRIGIFLDRQ